MQRRRGPYLHTVKCQREPRSSELVFGRQHVDADAEAHFLRLELCGPKEHAEETEVQRQSPDQQEGSADGVLVDEALSYQGSGQNAHCREAHGNARCQPTVLVEVKADGDERGRIT